LDVGHRFLLLRVLGRRGGDRQLEQLDLPTDIRLQVELLVGLRFLGEAGGRCREVHRRVGGEPLGVVDDVGVVDPVREIGLAVELLERLLRALDEGLRLLERRSGRGDGRLDGRLLRGGRGGRRVEGQPKE
jgi:hypothetical protein